MRKLLFAATVAGASLLPVGVTQAQCVCDSGYYGYGPAVYGYATLPPTPAPTHYAYAAPPYLGYDDGDAYAYYGGWGGLGYGVAGLGVQRGYYGYGATVGVGRLGDGYRTFGLNRVGWRGRGYRRNAQGHGLTPPPPATFDLKQRPTQEGAD